MTFSCGISPNGVYHTATAYGQLLSSSGARSPGYSNSEQGCVNCLISAGDTETLPILQDDQWNFQYDLQYICSAAGVLASIINSFHLELAYTKSKWNGTYTSLTLGAVRCYVTQWCTVATQPPLCNPSYVDQQPLIPGQQVSCWQYYNTTWLAESFAGGPWTCIPLIPDQNAVGTGDSSAMACTKHP